MCSKTSEAHTALGKILVRQGETQRRRVIEQLELAIIQLAPLDPAPHYVLGFTLRAMERNVEAAEIYETYLRLMPDAIDAPKMRQWIMHVKAHLGSRDTSPEHEDEGFVDYDPIALRVTDKVYQAALERFQKCTAAQTIDDLPAHSGRSAGPRPHAHFAGARVHARRRIREGGGRVCEQARLDLQPGCAEALYFLGQSFEKAGNSPKALKAYRRYCEENPDGPRVDKLRAWFLAHGVAEKAEKGDSASRFNANGACVSSMKVKFSAARIRKTTCNGCLTLMGSTPIQDSNKLETFDSAGQRPVMRRKASRRNR